MNQRIILTLLCGAVSWFILSSRYPFPEGEILPLLVARKTPWLYRTLDWSWTVMLFSTPAIFFMVLFNQIFIYVSDGTDSQRTGKLPPFPPPRKDRLQIVAGELHHPTKPIEVENPKWLTLPERGLHTGVAVFGAIGSGKTSAVLYPFCQQLFSWQVAAPELKSAGIILEVKGDFCYEVERMLKACGRAADYVELNIDGAYRYNPLHNDQDAFTMAYAIASLLNQLYGKGKEPFWQQAYCNLVKFIITLHRVVDGYVTLFDIYNCAINRGALNQKILQGQAKFAALANIDLKTYFVIDPMVYIAVDKLSKWTWETNQESGEMKCEASAELQHELDVSMQPYKIETPKIPDDLEDQADRLGKFEAVLRWYRHDWSAIDVKLKTSIVEGISVFLSLFDDNQKLKRIFCPPKETYDPVANADGKYGVVLPPMSELVEFGKILALNFPAGENIATSRVIITLLKQDFQRAMISRIPKMSKHPEKPWRSVIFVADEYHMIATAGESDPNGDEKFFSLSRQAKCIPIVATQSISSLESMLPGNTWKTLLQSFRTKIFLTLNDGFSAKIASELCGEHEMMLQNFSISESGQDASVSHLTGNVQAHKAGVSLNTSYQQQFHPIFRPVVFSQLQNDEAIILAYDGRNPLPAQRVYLKPHYRDRRKSYFEQKREEA